MKFKPSIFTITVIIVVINCASAIAEQIPNALKDNDVYSYVLNRADQSTFFKYFSPQVREEIAELIEVNSNGEKPFCNYYRKINAIPDLLLEYIIYTNKGGVDQVAILAYKTTASGENCIMIRLKSIAEFVDKEFFEYIKYFENIEPDNQFFLTHSTYTDMFSELLNITDLTSLEAAAESDREDSEPVQKKHFESFVAKFILKCRKLNKDFYLNPEVKNLGCYQLSNRYFCSALLVSSDMFGYGLISTLFKNVDGNIIIVGIYLEGDPKNIITNYPFVSVRK